MRFVVYSDIHWGQVSEILPNLVPSKGDFFLGDIFDIKNTSKKIIRQQLQKQSDFNRTCKEVGAFVLLGNHDLLPDDKMLVHYYDKNLLSIIANDHDSVPRHIVVGDILFTHGHYIAWDQTQIDQWKAKQPTGVGAFRRLTLNIESYWNRGTWKPSVIELERCVQLADGFKCKTIVFGHTHTAPFVDTMFKGVRILNVGRGRSVLEL